MALPKHPFRVKQRMKAHLYSATVGLCLLDLVHQDCLFWIQDQGLEVHGISGFLHKLDGLSLFQGSSPQWRYTCIVDSYLAK